MEAGLGGSEVSWYETLMTSLGGHAPVMIEPLILLNFATTLTSKERK